MNSTYTYYIDYTTPSGGSSSVPSTWVHPIMPQTSINYATIPYSLSTITDDRAKLKEELRLEMLAEEKAKYKSLEDTRPLIGEPLKRKIVLEDI